jgi:hypothetical protein
MSKAMVVEREQKEVQPVGNTPADMIRMAVAGKADLSQLRELLALQREWEAGEAQKAFSRDFAEAQSKIERVLKTCNNSQTKSKYADLAGVIESCKPVYTAHGFAVTFYENDSPVAEHVRVCADVRHRDGHKETFHFDVPLDGKGIKGNSNMTGIHAKASSTTYARRYLLCMIWNIATQDDDGNTPTVASDKITEDHLAFIRKTLADLDATNKEPDFVKFLGVERLEDLKLKDYQKAVTALTAMKARKEAKAKAEVVK